MEPINNAHIFQYGLREILKIGPRTLANQGHEDTQHIENHLHKTPWLIEVTSPTDRTKDDDSKIWAVLSILLGIHLRLESANPYPGMFTNDNYVLSAKYAAWKVCKIFPIR